MQIATMGQSATMSSREIAELVGATHDSVLKTVRRLIAEGIVFGDETPYTHPQNGQTYPEFILDFRNTMVVASGYSAELRARIIDRWNELEAAVSQTASSFKLPATFSEALRLAAEQAEKIEAQALQLQHQRPAVEFVDRYTVATGLKGVREVCKILNANERQFVDWLTGNGIMYRLAGRLTPYQPHIDVGRFVVKTGLSDDGHSFSSPKFTSKGVSWVAGEWGKFQVSGRG